MWHEARERSEQDRKVPMAPTGNNGASCSPARSCEAKIRDSKVLIVDDAVSHVTLLESLLHRLGYKHVRSLMDARELFGVIAEWQPDLLVLDLAMPHVSGLEVLDLLRSDTAGKEPI